MVFRLLAASAVLVPASLAQTGFSVGAIDRATDPCTDFYQYACGNWLQSNPIPADQAMWGRFGELHERNQRILKDILETSAAKPNRTSVEQKIGDYFAACMDEKTVNEKGVAPLEPVLKRISQITDKRALSREIAHLHTNLFDVLFMASAGQDFKNASEMILNLDQGGLGLPERDYYFKDDEKSVHLRNEYVAHLEKIFTLAGDDGAAEKAKTVMSIETALAKGHLDVTSRRDPSKLYHRMAVSDLAKLTPSIDWKVYLAGIGAVVSTLNVAVPEFFRTLEQQIQSVPLNDWKIYLRWQALRAQSALLSAPFAEANFDFYGRTLKGIKEIRPRWKRCVAFTNMDLGEALGQKYVELTFGAEGKHRTLAMVRALESALEKDIGELDWMTEDTKKRAGEKLRAITNKIGYPEKWRDYGKLEIRTGDLIGNSLRANRFEFRRQLAKIGKPVDKTEWFMTPSTVNAYYDPQNNNINFPAGILQPPFYDNTMDDAVNLGGIGAVIGHELTHGFDDEGGKFDARGNLENWWTESDANEFERRTECIEKQYSQYAPVPGLQLNGKLTLGENVADNGGLRIAYMALLDVLGGKKRDKIDGYTMEQRFFLAWGQIWCTNMTEEASRLHAQTDPHSPGRFRVNGSVSNMPEFWKAFGCRAGQPMMRGENACRVW